MTRVAEPHEMVMAWSCGPMYGGRKYAEEEVRRHPPTIPDPTFHRDEGGWRSAKNISSASAIDAMRAWLDKNGLRAPDETEAVWKSTLVRLDARSAVKERIDEAFRRAWKEGAGTEAEFANEVVAAVGGWSA